MLRQNIKGAFKITVERRKPNDEDPSEFRGSHSSITLSTINGKGYELGRETAHKSENKVTIGNRQVYYTAQKLNSIVLR